MSNLKYCAPGDRQTPTWILMFDDPDRSYGLYYDEREAYDAYEFARQNWNCYLFALALERDGPNELVGKIDQPERESFATRRPVTGDRVIGPRCGRCIGTVQEVLSLDQLLEKASAGSEAFHRKRAPYGMAVISYGPGGSYRFTVPLDMPGAEAYTFATADDLKKNSGPDPDECLPANSKAKE